MTPRIIESDGNIFDSGCTALVSPVDAVTGAQGKGLALEFKRRWPERCAEYREQCTLGRMTAGRLFANMNGEPFIWFAATKRHWREPSTLDYVRTCLVSIDNALRYYKGVYVIRDIAIPALGCGLGSLRWSDVRPLILDAAARMQCERVVIYGPK